jgi:hypothetical protein
MAFFFLIIIFLFSCFLPQQILANSEAANAPNNKFGIHLAIPAFEDLQKAAELVNANGDWGYVTLVMEEKDLNKDKWEGIFNQLRKLHLIPIIRLATSLENGHWRAPKKEDAQRWADFLNSLNWVVKNRYLVLFNEANRADEWGGQVNPQNFADVTYNFAKTLKESNSDFFVMMAGLDSAAPSQPNQYEDEAIFLKKVLNYQKDLFNYLDGWASHSYPKSYLNYGRNSQFNYQWELSLLSSLGIKKNLPIFITETGWCHSEGKSLNKSFPTEEKTAQLTVNYFSDVLKDNRVIAVTPFILNYQDEPFDHYSWQKINSNEFYEPYLAVQKMIKIKGQPYQEEKLTLISKLPEKLIKNSTYQISLIIKNEGQGFWDQKDGYGLIIEGLPADSRYLFSDFSSLLPFEERKIWLYLKTSEKTDKLKLKISLTKAGKAVNQIDWNLEIVPEIDIKLITKLLFKRKTTANDFKFLIYNQNEEVIFSLNDLPIKEGQTEIKGLKNLIIGETYRLVLIKPFYLPRQLLLVINEDNNFAVFKTLLPLDFNQDGCFTLKDLLSLFKKPKLITLWWIN